MANTEKPTPPQNKPKPLGIEGLRAEVTPTSPTVPPGTPTAQLGVTTVAKASQQLSSETVLDLLKMILAGASLNEVLVSLASILEGHAEGMLCLIWLLEEDGVHMRNIAAPSHSGTYVGGWPGLCS